MQNGEHEQWAPIQHTVLLSNECKSHLYLCPLGDMLLYGPNMYVTAQPRTLFWYLFIYDTLGLIWFIAVNQQMYYNYCL